MTEDDLPQTCAACGWVRTRDDEPDGCLGELPGVMAACCGHGEPQWAYIAFDNGVTVRGFTKIETGGVRRARD